VVAEEFWPPARRQSRRNDPGQSIHAGNRELPGLLRSWTGGRHRRSLLPKVRKSKVLQLIELARKGTEAVAIEGDPRVFPLESAARLQPRPHGSHLPTRRHPTIRVTGSFGDTHGWFRLSSLYGSEHAPPSTAYLPRRC